MAGDADNVITPSDQYAMASKTAPLQKQQPWVHFAGIWFISSSMQIQQQISKHSIQWNDYLNFSTKTVTGCHLLTNS